MKHYDYIICGGGMAGLSLAYYLKNSKLAGKSVLIIEPQEKNKNDRTWAFWEQGKNTFESILFRKWNKLELIDARGNTQILDTGGYIYKLLRGYDFYNFVINDLKKHENLEWLKDTVAGIKEDTNGAIVETQNRQLYKATYVFDSTYQLNLTLEHNHNLLQHFKGYVISTEKPAFDPEVPVMMNFNIEQKGDCRFMYILPFDAHTALVEYTVFSETLLQPEEYDVALKTYLKDSMPLHNYRILEEEFGVIPMSDIAACEHPYPHVVRIGTAGGYTNPATGYTFTNTQRKLKQLVDALEVNGIPRARKRVPGNRFRFYASVLLNVLEQKRYSAASIFFELYRKNPPARIFRFLDGDSTLWEELRIMTTVPKWEFTLAGLAVIARKIKAKLNGQLRP